MYTIRCTIRISVSGDFASFAPLIISMRECFWNGRTYHLGDSRNNCLEFLHHFFFLSTLSILPCRQQDLHRDNMIWLYHIYKIDEIRFLCQPCCTIEQRVFFFYALHLTYHRTTRTPAIDKAITNNREQFFNFISAMLGNSSSWLCPIGIEWER